MTDEHRAAELARLLAEQRETERKMLALTKAAVDSDPSEPLRRLERLIQRVELGVELALNKDTRTAHVVATLIERLEALERLVQSQKEH